MDPDKPLTPLLHLVTSEPMRVTFQPEPEPKPLDLVAELRPVPRKPPDPVLGVHPPKEEYDAVLARGDSWQYRHHRSAGIVPWGPDEGWRDVRRDLSHEQIEALGCSRDEEWRPRRTARERAETYARQVGCVVSELTLDCSCGGVIWLVHEDKDCMPTEFHDSESRSCVFGLGSPRKRELE